MVTRTVDLALKTMSFTVKIPRRPLLVAALPTPPGRVLARAVWIRPTYVLRLDGTNAALRALLPEGQLLREKAKELIIRPPKPITKADFEAFYDDQARHWRVLNLGMYSEFAGGHLVDPENR